MFALCCSCAEKSDGEDDNKADPAYQLATLVPPALKPTEAVPQDTSCASPECHSRFLTDEFVHGPAAAGECFVCHGPDTGGHAYPTAPVSDVEACRACHDAVGLGAQPHQALEARGCISCHDPHTGTSASLIHGENVQQLCGECHPESDRRLTHEPYGSGECLACHEPHESEHGSLLRGGEGAEHCFLCHSDMADHLASATFRHDGVERQCAICHTPHASDITSLLTAPIDRLCFECHEDRHTEIASAITPHPPVTTGDRCMTCHSPHVSDFPSILRDRQGAVCLQCHDVPVTASDGRTLAAVATEVMSAEFVHSPARNDNCSACHAIHGSDRFHLLEASFPPDFYASFNIDLYLLCFQCHEKGLVLEKRTEALTDFRNGDLNLHYLHVHSDEKGRTCRACHSIHGSNNPNHLAEQVLFEGSDWLMPIDFKMEEGGGSCAPGCHEPMSYRRSPMPPIPETSRMEDQP